MHIHTRLSQAHQALSHQVQAACQWQQCAAGEIGPRPQIAVCQLCLNILEVHNTTFQLDIVIRDLACLVFYACIGSLQVRKRLCLLVRQPRVLPQRKELAHDYQRHYSHCCEQQQWPDGQLPRITGKYVEGQRQEEQC